MSTNLCLDKAKELKYHYLMAQGAEGGHKQDFINGYVSAWLENADNLEFVKQHHAALFKSACDAIWGEKLSTVPGNQPSLLLNDEPAQVELRYKDLRAKEYRVPGGYITVLTDCATIHQFALAWMVVQENANKQVQAAEKMRQQLDWLLKQSNGNEQMKIVDAVSLTSDHDEDDDFERVTKWT